MTDTAPAPDPTSSADRINTLTTALMQEADSLRGLTLGDEYVELLCRSTDPDKLHRATELLLSKVLAEDESMTATFWAAHYSRVALHWAQQVAEPPVTLVQGLLALAGRSDLSWPEDMPEHHPSLRHILSVLAEHPFQTLREALIWACGVEGVTPPATLTIPAEEPLPPPSHAVAGYLLNRLANPMSVDQEVLLTLLFYLEKSQGLPAMGADDGLLAQLERETFDDTVTQQLKAGLLRLMVNPPTPQFFHQALGILLRFNDAQLQPFLVTWLDAQLRQLLQANQAINQLLLCVKPVKGVPRRNGGSVPDIEGNVTAARQYLKRALGIDYPY